MPGINLPDVSDRQRLMPSPQGMASKYTYIRNASPVKTSGIVNTRKGEYRKKQTHLERGGLLNRQQMMLTPLTLYPGLEYVKPENYFGWRKFDKSLRHTECNYFSPLPNIHERQGTVSGNRTFPDTSPNEVQRKSKSTPAMDKIIRTNTLITENHEEHHAKGCVQHGSKAGTLSYLGGVHLKFPSIDNSNKSVTAGKISRKTVGKHKSTKFYALSPTSDKLEHDTLFDVGRDFVLSVSAKKSSKDEASLKSSGFDVPDGGHVRHGK